MFTKQGKTIAALLLASAVAASVFSCMAKAEGAKCHSRADALAAVTLAAAQAGVSPIFVAETNEVKRFLRALSDEPPAYEVTGDEIMAFPSQLPGVGLVANLVVLKDGKACEGPDSFFTVTFEAFRRMVQAAKAQGA